MKRINKYLYLWKLWVDYGQGWEHEISELSLREAKQRRREYSENCPEYPTKITYGRELNPEFKGRA